MPDRKIIKIGYLKITDHLILGITLDKLKNNQESFNHCELEAIQFSSWNNIADALAEGEIDGAFMLAPTAMDLYKSGVQIKLILFTHKGGSVIIKNRSAGIKNLHDFKGKVVLIPYQLSIQNVLFHRLLSSVDLKPGTSNDPDVDVFLEVMAPSMMPEALQFDEEGEIGGFIVAEPFGSQSVEMGIGEEFCLSGDLWKKHPCCVFVIKDDIISNHHDAVVEVTQSFVKSGNFIEENYETASSIGEFFLNQPESVMKKILDPSANRICTSELYPVISDLEAIQDYMFDDMKIIDSKIDISGFVDTKFADLAGAK